MKSHHNTGQFHSIPYQHQPESLLLSERNLPESQPNIYRRINPRIGTDSGEREVASLRHEPKFSQTDSHAENSRFVTVNTLASWYNRQKLFFNSESRAKRKTASSLSLNVSDTPTAPLCATNSIVSNDIQSIPITPLHEYAQFLKTVYKKRYLNCFKSQRMRFRAQKYINLALVHKEPECDDKDREVSILLQLHGKVDEILNRKTPLSISEVGKLDTGDKAQCILVEGAPGVGKTTFAWELCHQWEQGILLQEWDIVVMLQLRDKRIREASCLSDLLYSGNAATTDKICEHILRSQGEGILLLLDGCDELSLRQHPDDSMFWKVINRELLPFSTLLVTSRPFTTKRLGLTFTQSVDQHIEILGFRKEDIRDYILASLGDNASLLQDFKYYLASHPFAHSVMYIPLHCGIVTEIYRANWRKGGKGFTPKTLTELYTSLVRTLLLRYIDEHPLFQNRKPVKEFSDLPEDIHQWLIKLGELAADGIEKQQYIFEGIPCDPMGLMVKSENQYYDQDPTESFCFIHLTLQEYLAALYWSHYAKQELEELLTRPNLFPIDKFILKSKTEMETKSSSFTHWPVLLFIAGLTKLEGLSVSILRSSMPNPPVAIEDYITPVMTSLCQLLFETQSPLLVSSCFPEGNFKPTLDSSLDAVVVGYCIAHSTPRCNWYLMYFVHEHKPQHLLMLATGLHYSNDTSNRGGNITDVHLDAYDQLSECIEVLPRLHPYTSELRVLRLSGLLTFGKANLDLLVQFATFYPKLQELTVLSARNASQSWSQLIYSLPQLPCLHNLFFAFIHLPENCPEEETSVLLCNPLSQCLALKHFKLWLSNTSSDSTILAERVVSKLFHKLESFELDYCILSSTTVTYMIDYLQSTHCTIRKLKLGSCSISVADLNKLLKIISFNTSLKQLVFENLSQLGEVVKSLEDLISRNTTLYELILWESTLTTESAEKLARAFEHSKLSSLVLHESSEEKLSHLVCDRVKFVRSTIIHS